MPKQGTHCQNKHAKTALPKQHAKQHCQNSMPNSIAKTACQNEVHIASKTQRLTRCFVPIFVVCPYLLVVQFGRHMSLCWNEMPRTLTALYLRAGRVEGIFRTLCFVCFTKISTVVATFYQFN